jgi:hypothetical protein
VDAYNQMEAAADAARRTEEEANRNHERNSRARLQRILATKMRTAFIGALSAVEQSVESELAQYTVSWNRCQKTLPVEEDS